MFFLLIYRIFSSVFFLIFLPFIVLISQFVNKWKEGIPEKIGFIPENFFWERKAQNIWLHAVSFGEVKTIEPLIYELQKSFPLAQIWLSTGTKTGQDLAKKLFKEIRVFYCPFDFYFAVKNWFTLIKPDLVLIAETEIWPEMLLQCKEKQIPIFLINARLTDKSVKKYKLIYPIIKCALNCFSEIYAQSETNKKRFLALGFSEQKSSVLPSLKFDSALELKQNIKVLDLNELKNIFPTIQNQTNKILIAGSTHAKEEEFIIQIFNKCLENSKYNWYLILAPRHLERLSEIENLLIKQNLKFIKKSLINTNNIGENKVVLLDTMGELGLFYALADIAFIGGTWADIGGHNLLEATIWNLPICIGNYNYKIYDLIENLKEYNYPILQSLNSDEIVEWVFTQSEISKQNNELIFTNKEKVSKQIIKQISKFIYLEQYK